MSRRAHQATRVRYATTYIAKHGRSSAASSSHVSLKANPSPMDRTNSDVTGVAQLIYLHTGPHSFLCYNIDL